MPTSFASTNATWLGNPTKREPAMVLELDQYELENMQRLISMMCKCSELFPMHTGDWTYQILNKLRPTLGFVSANASISELHDALNTAVPKPAGTIPGHHTHVLPNQTLEKINVKVGEVLTDFNMDTFQIVIFYHHYSNESQTDKTIMSSHEVHVVSESIPLNTKMSDNTLMTSRRDVEKNAALTPGTYEYSDYLIMKALKEKDEK